MSSGIKADAWPFSVLSLSSVPVVWLLSITVVMSQKPPYKVGELRVTMIEHCSDDI